MTLSNLPPPDRKKYLHIKKREDWQNPFLVLNIDGTLDIIADGAMRKQIKINELEDVLCLLQSQAWTYGKVIAVQPCAARSADKETFAREDQALKDAWSRMREILGKLEIQVNLWPSSD
jgi:hypothetical protein